MRYIGILSRFRSGWVIRELERAIKAKGLKSLLFRFRDIVVNVESIKPKIYVRGINLLDILDAVIVRPIGRVSLDRAIFRIDVLYMFEENGVYVLNKPSCIEKAVDKFRSIYILSKNGIPTPHTLVSENADILIRYIGRCKSKEYVVKPLFGSRGLGSTMIEDLDVLWRVLHTLSYYRYVLYLQEYLKHEFKDIRAFVVGDEVIASMIRLNPLSWKTNIARGAKPIPTNLDEELKELAVKSCEVLGCEVAGVDILLYKDNPYVLEVNSQPDWRGLQSVSDVNIADRIIDYLVGRIKK